MIPGRIACFAAFGCLPASQEALRCRKWLPEELLGDRFRDSLMCFAGTIAKA